MANSYNVYINRLPLPQGLLDLIDSGRWQSPADQSKVDLVFSWSRWTKTIFAWLYAIRKWTLDQRNQSGVFWCAGCRKSTWWYRSASICPDWRSGHRVWSAHRTGLRVSLHEPRVLTLKWSQNGRSNRWVEIAPDVRTFSEMLGLWTVKQRPMLYGHTPTPLVAVCRSGD